MRGRQARTVPGRVSRKGLPVSWGGASDRGAHVAPSQITGTTRVALGTWAAMLPWGKATRFSQCICEPGHSEQAGHRLGWALPRGSWLEHRQACRSLGWNGQGVAWPRGLGAWEEL